MFGGVTGWSLFGWPGAPVSGRVKWACSGTQMSLQISHWASAWMVAPVTWVAVKGSRMSPERT